MESTPKTDDRRSDRAFAAGLLFLFLVSTSAPGLALLERPTHDTLSELLSLRIWASDLLHTGDWPLWFPYARYGFPNTTLHLISSVFNPLGLLLGRIFRYDVWTLQLEFTIWRAVGLAGAYVFARRHTQGPTGAAAVAACYMASGVLETTSWMRTIFPGLALTPWCLAGLDRMIASEGSRTAWLRGVGITSFSFAVLVWSGYPGTWLTLPFLSVPLVLALAAGSAARLIRAITGGVCTAVLVLAMTAFPAFQTIAFPLFGAGLRNEASPFEGVLAPQNLLGLWLANPDYLPGLNGTSYFTIYCGVIPLVAVCASLPLLAGKRGSWLRPALLTAAGMIAVLGMYVDPGPGEAASIHWIAWAACLFATAAYPRSAALARWSRVDVALGTTALIGLLLATSNPMSDALRYHVFPFTILRWNWTYGWVTTLMVPLLGWRAIERWVGTDRKHGPRRAYVTTHQLAEIAIPTAGVVAVVLLLANLRLIVGPEDAFFDVRIGFALLWWQLALAALLIAGTVGFAARQWFRSHLTALLLTAGCALGTAAAITGWQLFGQDELIRSSLPVPPGSRQIFDAVQMLGALGAFALVVTRAASRREALRGAALVMVLDICLAFARYGSDGGTRVLVQGLTTASPARAFSFSGAQRTGDEDVDAPQWTLLGQGETKQPTVWIWADAVPHVAALDHQIGKPTIFRDFAVFPANWRTGAAPWQVVVPPAAFRAQQSRDESSSAPDCRTLPGPSPAAGAQATVTRLLSSKVVFATHTDCSRLMVVTDTWAQGWRVSIDGQAAQALEVNGALRGVMVPGGSHSVEWVYRPPHLVALMLVTSLGALVSLGLMVVPDGYRGRRGRRGAPGEVH